MYHKSLIRLPLPRFHYEITYTDLAGRWATLFGSCLAHEEQEAVSIAQNEARNLDWPRRIVAEIHEIKVRNSRPRLALPIMDMNDFS